MKNLLFIIPLIIIQLAFLNYCSAQWQYNGNNIYYNDGNVGIGTDMVNFKLELHDNTTTFFARDTYSSYYQAFVSQIGIGNSSNGAAGIWFDASDGDFIGMDYGSLTQRDDLSIALSNRSDGPMKFGVGDFYGPNHYKMTILASGNIGIGTPEPLARLHIADGDIYISDSTKGIIMKSPNGQCWRGTLTNEGVLQFSLIPCPELTVSINAPVPSWEHIKIYPNPTDNHVGIVIESEESIFYNLGVYDINGRALKTKEINQNYTNVNVEDLPSGIYVFKISDESGNFVTSKKVIIK